MSDIISLFLCDINEFFAITPVPIIEKSSKISAKLANEFVRNNLLVNTNRNESMLYVNILTFLGNKLADKKYVKQFEKVQLRSDHVHVCVAKNILAGDEIYIYTILMTSKS